MNYEIRTSRRRRGMLLAFALAAAVFGAGGCGKRPAVPSQKAAVQPESLQVMTPRQTADRGFVSSQACQNCHADQYSSWHRTFHRTMTQLATPETVVAPFDNVTLASRGREYRLEQDGDRFWVTMIDPDWEARYASQPADPSAMRDPPRVRKPVVMTTGSHHMQGYWFPAGTGSELLQIPFFYHIAKKRWIPREDVFLRPPDRDSQLASWNMICIKCHSVAGVPGGIPGESPMFSTVAELGIACEACHGPGEGHVRASSEASAGGAAATTASQQSIVNPARVAPRVQSEICGQCHSEFVPTDPVAFWIRGLPYRAAANFGQSHTVVRQGDQVYQFFGDKFKYSFWNDGTCRVGGDEYNALIESPCYQRGELSCLSCHSLHNSDPADMLAEHMDGNRACQQCHGDARFNEDVSQHTHHAAGSSGSRCYNCHMPHTSYALLTAMRSHRVTNPQVQPLAHAAPPNACNLCHLDRTLEWTAERLSAWYGAPEVTLGDDERTIAASLLWLLKGDAVQRAVAGWHMGWQPALEVSGNNWQAPFLAQLLQDPYAAVRYQVIGALRQLPDLADFGGDFIGSASHRQAAQREVLEIWGRSDPAHRGQNRQQLLLDSNGQLRQDELDRLLRQRDDSYVRIPE